ncbi:ubiquitin-like protein [Hamiltosporidium tvaerminnensis]|uniref:Ubiquitin-like protein n=2 Tax=Hamiltosporidium TaxID=1176354 RepID=A0A4Q9KWJ1_9MICR|nr:ubiquitin-like protein [Hamiltosporidium magnivora]TBU00875.1 ubiquitin-like protein [Hamiltosporidium magnivora]TBU13441.1 ubiquitin-like protein [Hamiltosporidium tvaerminnensis]
MQIKIKTLEGREIEIETDHNETVKKIEDYELIPPLQQRLIYYGKIMSDDSKKLVEYNVNNGCVVHLVLALRGG